MNSVLESGIYPKKESKQQYRTDLEIVSDVLETTMEYGMRGVLISIIARDSNLSHYRAIDKCQKLVDAGLIELKINQESRRYYITEKGINLFHQMQKFVEISR